MCSGYRAPETEAPRNQKKKREALRTLIAYRSDRPVYNASFKPTMLVPRAVLIDAALSVCPTTSLPLSGNTGDQVDTSVEEGRVGSCLLWL